MELGDLLLQLLVYVLCTANESYRAQASAILFQQLLTVLDNLRVVLPIE